MDNAMKVFNNDVFGDVRTLVRDGEPWFVARDVCAALDIALPQRAYSRLDAEEKGVHIVNTLGGSQEMIIINESGLYSLILTSRKPEAKAFKRWITRDVIPSIRKHGGYLMGQESMTHEELLSAALRYANKVMENYEKRIQQQNETIGIMAPKAEFYDEVISTDRLYQASVVAMMYNMSTVKFNRMLHELHVQYYNCNMWMLYQEHKQKGYAELFWSRPRGKKCCYPSLRWTMKGIEFIYQKFKDALGILPRDDWRNFLEYADASNDEEIESSQAI